jgi:DNA-binding transcriptional MerR regulator
MLKIGNFSRFTDVTIKTLHHYDEVGLLKPAEVDRFTGYRYYTVEQMERLNRILALKDLGFSLEQIAQVLDDDLPASEIRGMLKLRQAELEQQIATEQARLARVETRLKLIEQEGKMPKHEVIIKKVAAQRVLSFREMVPGASSIKPFFLDVARALEEHKIVSTGPWLALYHHSEYREVNLDLEAAIPVSKTVKAPIPLDHERQMVIRMLPSRTVASVVCRKVHQVDVLETSKALWTWIERNGYHVLDAPCREVYAEAPQEGKPVIFEIQLAVEKTQ